LKKMWRLILKNLLRRQKRGQSHRNYLRRSPAGGLPENIATFNNNVKVVTSDTVITADQMEVYFSSKEPSGKEASHGIDNMAAAGSRIEKIYARGNVTITRGDNVSHSEEAVYSAADNKITLMGRPKLVIYSSEGLNASSGN